MGIFDIFRRKKKRPVTTVTSNVAPVKMSVVTPSDDGELINAALTIAMYQSMYRGAEPDEPKPQPSGWSFDGVYTYPPDNNTGSPSSYDSGSCDTSSSSSDTSSTSDSGSCSPSD